MQLSAEEINLITVWGFKIGIISLVISIISLVITIIVLCKTKGIEYILSNKSDILRYNSIRKSLITSFKSINQIVSENNQVSLSIRNEIFECLTKLRSLNCITKIQKKAIDYLLKELDYKTRETENIKFITQNISTIVAELDRGKKADEYK